MTTYEQHLGSDESDTVDFTSRIAEITDTSNQVLAIKNERIRRMEQEIFPDIQGKAVIFAGQMMQAGMPVDEAYSNFGRTVIKKGWFGAEHAKQEVTSFLRPVWLLTDGCNLAGEKINQDDESETDKESVAVTLEGSLIIVRAQDNRRALRRINTSLKLTALFGNYPESTVGLDSYVDKADKLFVQSANKYAMENEKTDTTLRRSYELRGHNSEHMLVPVNTAGWEEIIPK